MLITPRTLQGFGERDLETSCFLLSGKCSIPTGTVLIFVEVFWCLFVFTQILWIPNPEPACMPELPGNKYISTPICPEPPADKHQSASLGEGGTVDTSSSSFPRGCPHAQVSALRIVLKSISLLVKDPGICLWAAESWTHAALIPALVDRLLLLSWFPTFTCKRILKFPSSLMSLGVL